MSRYIFRRLLVSIPVFLAITVVVYGLYALSPGDPVADVLGEEAMLRMTSEQIEGVRHQLGLDQPWTVRYLIWLSRAARGDLGYPLRGSLPVAELIAERVGPTLLLMGTALLLALLLGIPMGILMALKQYSWLDYVVTVLAFAALSIPAFFLGLGFIYVFALKLNILPTYGMQTIGAPFSLVDRLAHLIMPAAILGLFHAGVWARYARSSMLEVMRAEYVTTARAKGLTERAVIIRHVFRNALLPLVTIVSLSLPGLLGGPIVTETIFQWPGLGMLAWRATLNRDYAILMGITLVSTTMILLSNLIADIAYALVDPRIRFD